MTLSKKNLRRVSMLIASQSAYNLEKLRVVCGYNEIGQVVDKLVREKMLSLHIDNFHTTGKRDYREHSKKN